MKKESFITKLSDVERDLSFIQTQNLLNKMDGWFSAASHGMFQFFLRYQNENKINGNLGEIGVWKGKSAAVISKFSKENESVFLIDPLIKDFSETIYRNIDYVCKKISEKLVMCNIVSDNFDKIPNYQSLLHSFRFFHIDGCHTGTNIFKDLKLADSLISTDGIVVVDDFFNYSYPQITEALYRYLQVNPFSYRLFCVGYNKAYLCRPEKLSEYYSYCLNNIQLEFMKMQMAICVKKTSGLGDSYTISINGFEKETDPLSGFRGPDWNPNKLDRIVIS
jgi:hypothetical protein